MAGNAAVCQLLGHSAGQPPAVQRCGPVPCGCPEEERAAHEAAGTTSMAVQRACGSREIGAHPGCDPAVGDLPPGARPFLFTVNCDTFDHGQEGLLRASVGPGDRVVVHGFASVEGSPGYNRDLSCARAERAAGLLSDIGAVVESIRAHGGTPGERINRRSVVVERPSSEPQDRASGDDQDRAPGDQSDDASRPVFICAKPLAASPVGNHAFFRVGGSGPGNHTIELEPAEVRPGCYQGIPQSDFAEDVDSPTTNCLPITSAEADLDAESAAYPRGHYCTFGPNSNTFVGVLARRTGAGGVRPSGWLPGFDDGPPPAGTFAPSPFRTLFGCTTKECPPESQQQLECVMDMGACGIPGGIPTGEDRHRWNDDCRGRTGYSGPDVDPSPEDCAAHGASVE